MANAAKKGKKVLKAGKNALAKLSKHKQQIAEKFRMVGDAIVSNVSAGASGFVRGRWGMPELGGIPADIIAGSIGLAAGIFDVAGDYSHVAAAVGSGALPAGVASESEAQGRALRAAAARKDAAAAPTARQRGPPVAPAPVPELPPAQAVPPIVPAQPAERSAVPAA